MKEKIIAVFYPYRKCILALGNLGAGNSTMKAVFDGLFTRVMLDKSFIQQQITHRSFEPFIRAIQQISPCCNCIIAGGIDTAEILAQITPFDFHALEDACGLPFP